LVFFLPRFSSHLINHFISYAFLVYNASLELWRVARHLMQPGRFKQILPALEAIQKALDEVNDEDIQWRVAVYMCAHAFCFRRVDLTRKRTAEWLWHKTMSESQTMPAKHLLQRLHLQPRHQMVGSNPTSFVLRFEQSFSVTHPSSLICLCC
jgi:hypothetical protein